jgi:hypothetical protein
MINGAGSDQMMAAVLAPDTVTAREEPPEPEEIVAAARCTAALPRLARDRRGVGRNHGGQHVATGGPFGKLASQQARARIRHLASTRDDKRRHMRVRNCSDEAPRWPRNL